jgi:hypothetical protein
MSTVWAVLWVVCCLNHVNVVQVQYMDFVIVGEDALLEDGNINVSNSAVVFKNNRVRVAVFRQFILWCYVWSMCSV